MEITIGSDDCVMVHDDRLAVSLLKSILSDTTLSTSEMNSYQSYLETAEQRSKIYNCDETMKALRKIGCKAIPIAGRFEHQSQITMNFCNGLRLGAFPNAFITNAAPARFLRLQQAFAQIYTEHNPELKIGFVSGMDKSLTELNGGLRCASLELLKPVEPKEIPRPLKRRIENVDE